MIDLGAALIGGFVGGVVFGVALAGLLLRRPKLIIKDVSDHRTGPYSVTTNICPRCQMMTTPYVTKEKG